MFYHSVMTAARYIETTCKSAINRVQGMPFRWSLNPYRGCRHRCAYCYARVTHTYMGLDAGQDFDGVIFVKTNVAQVLRAELRKSRWGGEPVAIGTATDPYQPIEGRYRLTRGCLQAMAEAGNRCSVTTKGTLVVRDIDLLQDLAAGPGCGVNISLITLDTAIWRALEPGTPPPQQRLRALGRLAAAGVPCGLALAPILPGLTDTPAALEAVVRAAADHGATWLWSGTLHVEPAVRDWFLGALARHFPAAVPGYARVYGPPGAAWGARYTPRAESDRLRDRVRELKVAYGLDERRQPKPPSAVSPADRTPSPHLPAPRPPRQLALPW
jgi:DNA repair photolyase